MSTATTQQTGSVKPTRAEIEPDPAQGGPDAVAVLIRLPDLSHRGGASPSRPAENVVRQPGLPAGEPDPPAPAEPVPASSQQAGRPQHAAEPSVDQGPMSSVQRAAPPNRNHRPPPRFDPEPFLRQFRRTPRVVWQAASAAAVLLLIILAVMSIRGGSGGRTVVEHPPGGSPADPIPADVLPRSPEYSVAALEPPNLKVSPRLPDPSAQSPLPRPQDDIPMKSPRDKPAAEESQTRDAAPPVEPKTASSAADKPAADKPAAEKPLKDETAVEKTAAGDPSAAPAAKDPSDVAPPLSMPASPPAAPSDQPPGTGAEPVAERGQPRQDQTGEQNPARHYPLTNPATYQYPSDYEQLFRGPWNDPSASAGATTQDRGSMYRWQPNTARLQPAIEPPPTH